MNSKRTPTLRISTMHSAIALFALAIAFLVGGAITARAQEAAAERVVYNFIPPTGYSPTGVIRDGAGNLYLATNNGGSNEDCYKGCGNILELSPPYRRPTTLYTFTPSGFDFGLSLPSGLVRDAKGDLYGATTNGGRYHSGGSVFKLSPSGAEGTLHSFDGGNDGYNPSGGLTIDSLGNLYGTTEYGGGTVCASNPPRLRRGLQVDPLRPRNL